MFTDYLISNFRLVDHDIGRYLSTQSIYLLTQNISANLINRTLDSFLIENANFTCIFPQKMVIG